MKLSATELKDVWVIEPVKHGDDRGFFSEVYREDILSEHGINVKFVQDNHAYSKDVGVLRGLHFQKAPYAQDKLVRVTKGAIYDVVVDLRKGSPTYAKWIGVEISAENWKQILVPKGFAHGYVTLMPDTEVEYKVSGYYNPESDSGLLWNDTDLAIDWQIEDLDPILSDKDKAQPTFAETDSNFLYE